GYHHRFRQMTIVFINVKPNRPEFVMVRLPHLHLGHPIEDFARIEIAKNAPLELQKTWRVNRVTEIEQHIWSSQPIEQISFRYSDAIHPGDIMRGIGRL